jgi:hypothetical protein
MKRRSSPIAERAFCAECGTPLFLQYDDSSDVGLMIGIIDQAAVLTPTYHYDVEGRLPWAEVGHNVHGITEGRYVRGEERR